MRIFNFFSRRRVSGFNGKYFPFGSLYVDIRNAAPIDHGGGSSWQRNVGKFSSCGNSLHVEVCSQ